MSIVEVDRHLKKKKGRKSIIKCETKGLCVFHVLTSSPVIPGNSFDFNSHGEFQMCQTPKSNFF